MILYRAMCDLEFQDMQKFNSLSWNSKHKWFGTESFVKSRVQDGQFNNSRFVNGRYNNLVRFEISDDSLQYFSKCGNREFKLERRKAPMIKILSWEKI